MKLCMDCKWYGGVKASNGSYICKKTSSTISSIRSTDCRMPMTLLPAAHGYSELQQIGCGMAAQLVEGQIRRLTLNAVCGRRATTLL